MENVILPIEEWAKQVTVGCSACGGVAPFTLQEFEDAPAHPELAAAQNGWQLRLLATNVVHDNGAPGRGWRWDLFCPACAGEMSPQPPNSIRLRLGSQGGAPGHRKGV